MSRDSMDYAFYKEHLDRVSRSFAFCIEELREPFREWVALSYLVLRMLDTIEDARWEEEAVQKSQFRLLEEIIRTGADPVRVSAWSGRFPAGLPEGEKGLLADAHLVLRAFHRIPPVPRRYIEETALSMSAGMQHFQCWGEDGHNAIRITSLRELNYYCFFVAGVIGELLISLLALVNEGFHLGERCIAGAYSLGITLQKVNMLKDQNRDEDSGKVFLFDRSQVLDSLRENIERGFEFILSLPLEEVEFRLFCLWSFFLGLASLHFVEASRRRGEPQRISREQTRALLHRVRASVGDNEELQGLFNYYTTSEVALFRRPAGGEGARCYPWTEPRVGDAAGEIARRFRARFRRARSRARKEKRIWAAP